MTSFSINEYTGRCCNNDAFALNNRCRTWNAWLEYLYSFLRLSDLPDWSCFFFQLITTSTFKNMKFLLMREFLFHIAWVVKLNKPRMQWNFIISYDGFWKNVKRVLIYKNKRWFIWPHSLPKICIIRAKGKVKKKIKIMNEFY